MVGEGGQAEGWWGRVGSQRWVISSSILLGVAMSPRSASHRPKQS